jgi:hypothetical protein
MIRQTDALIPLATYRILITRYDDTMEDVLKQIQGQRGRLIIVVPLYTKVFLCREDFQVLKRLEREQRMTITLVLYGRKRLRTWARNQGFRVYASTRVCMRTLERRLSRQASLSFSPLLSPSNPLHSVETEPLTLSFTVKKLCQEDIRFILILTLLLLLGILGGIGFGYLLSATSPQL